MTKKEIIKRLKDGDVITRRSLMKFKHGKLDRGINYSFYLGEDKIRENQFEAVREFLKKDSSSPLSEVKYTYKEPESFFQSWDNVIKQL